MDVRPYPIWAWTETPVRPCQFKVRTDKSKKNSKITFFQQQQKIWKKKKKNAKKEEQKNAIPLVLPNEEISLICDQSSPVQPVSDIMGGGGVP